MPTLAPQTSESLRDQAARRNLLYGCSVQTAALLTDAAYAALVGQQAGIVTDTTVMGWPALRPSPTEFRFQDADALLAFAEGARIRLRGETLCPPRELPPWFAASASAANARGLLAAHIARVAGRYAGRMHSWDVASDTVDPAGGRPDGLRESTWLRLLGPDYLEYAFHAAREADPQALLTLREDALHAATSQAEAKRIAVLLLLRRLRARRVPLDALAIRAQPARDEQCATSVPGFLRSVRELGLEIFLTGLSSPAQAVNASKPSRGATYSDRAADQERGTGRAMAGLLDIFLAEPASRLVMTAELPFMPPFSPASQPTGTFFTLQDALARQPWRSTPQRL